MWETNVTMKHSEYHSPSMILLWQIYKFVKNSGKYIFEILDSCNVTKINIDRSRFSFTQFHQRVTSRTSIVQYHNQLTCTNTLYLSCSDFTNFLCTHLCLFRSVQIFACVDLSDYLHSQDTEPFYHKDDLFVHHFINISFSFYSTTCTPDNY